MQFSWYLEFTAFCYCIHSQLSIGKEALSALLIPQLEMLDRSFSFQGFSQSIFMESKELKFKLLKAGNWKWIT